MRRSISVILTLMLAVVAVGCASAGKGKIKLDPKNPVTITVWHYYNGAIMNAFDQLVRNFNEMVGEEEGIIIESYAHGNIGDLEKAVLASANNEIGSMEMPNIFASYADTAYAAEQMGLLANMGEYFTKEEQAEYIDSYIEEGEVGVNDELRIFPIAKSTEIMLLNDTDWKPFAADMDVSYDDLATMEGVARISQLYYEWSGGKSFFGRDVMANLFIAASKEFDIDIFDVESGKVTLNIDETVMRKIWDYYYVPYISGYYSSYGRFRSDDAKTGDILCYVGSTASVMYFPSEVTTEEGVYPVQAKAMAAPLFAGAKRVMVQQGAGMVVAKATPREEYASTVFLKWFTEPENNIAFSSLSGYLPVKKIALDYDEIKKQITGTDIMLDPVADAAMELSINEINSSLMYTNKAFNGGAAARAVLEQHLQDKTVADREGVLQLTADGVSHEDAVARYANDAAFDAWLIDFSEKLHEAAGV